MQNTQTSTYEFRVINVSGEVLHSVPLVNGVHDDPYKHVLTTLNETSTWDESLAYAIELYQTGGKKPNLVLRDFWEVFQVNCLRQELHTKKDQASLTAYLDYLKRLPNTHYKQKLLRVYHSPEFINSKYFGWKDGTTVSLHSRLSSLLLPKTTLILISGYKGSGKDFVGDKLANRLSTFTRDLEVYHFARPMKEILADTLGIEAYMLETWKNDGFSVTLPNGKEVLFRTMLEHLGNEAMKPKFGQEVWANLLMNKVLSLGRPSYVIVPDFRFKIEDSFAQKHSSVLNIIKVRVTSPQVKRTSNHASETEMDEIKFDFMFTNDKTDPESFNVNLHKLLDFVLTPKGAVL
jgi:hypothetical protein